MCIIEKIKLLVDSREPEKIFHYLDKQPEIEYMKVALPCGDFVCGNIIIERKSISDFACSIKNGHLQKQLLQMQNFEHSFLLISGKIEELHYDTSIHGWTANHHNGAGLSCLIRTNTKIWQVPNDKQLVECVIKICQKVNDGKEWTKFDTSLFKPLKGDMTKDDLLLRVLCSFDSIGVKRAKKLLEEPVIRASLESFINEVETKRTKT